ncbi:MAG: thiamine diphosphokinase [Balneolaceae bacterium]|nr:MAG: thiamine diphosphokinase [Balneolaceae bacterium]
MKAVIICDGELAPKYVIERDLENSSLLIAADGGAYKAIESGFSPDVIIGDLDSYIPSGDEKAEIFRDQSQETNDLEKALNYARQTSATEVVVFGATGNRLDHTLKNLSVLLQFNRQFHTILFKDRYSEIRVIHSPFSEEFPLHTSISLFPLSGTVEGITTNGLKYPLVNGTLENGVQDGSSNETIKKTVEIEFKKGDLLLLVNYKTERE